METITGIFQDRLSSEQNADGKFDVMIKRDKGTYRTGFIFDSIKLMSEYAIRTCQIDSEGNKKFGVVTKIVLDNLSKLPLTSLDMPPNRNLTDNF